MRRLAYSLILVLPLSFAACSSDNGGSSTPANNNNNSSSEGPNSAYCQAVKAGADLARKYATGSSAPPEAIKSFQDSLATASASAPDELKSSYANSFAGTDKAEADKKISDYSKSVCGVDPVSITPPTTG